MGITTVLTSARLKAILLFVAALMAPEQCCAQNQTPKQFAEKVLNLYKTKDVRKLLALSPDGRPPASVLERYAPGTGRYNSLFGDGSWRWKAVQEWKGDIESIRYDRQALVEFAQDNEPGRTHFVRMQLQGGMWKFESMSLDDAKSLVRRQFNRVKANETSTPMIGDLKTVAVQVLKAFQAKDVDAVLKLSVADGPFELQYLSEEEKKQPKAKFLFSNDQMAGVDSWAGKVGAVYISETAFAEFGRSDSEVFVVTMPRVGDEWKFDDIHSPDAADFDAMRPADYAGDAKAASSPEKSSALFSDGVGRFQVKMPGEPTHNVTKIGKGPDDVQHQFLVGVSNGVFMVAYQDHRGLDNENPAATENVFDVARDGFQKGIAGERTEYRRIKQGKLDGRETRFRIPANGGEATTRMFFVNQRWYHVFVMGTPEFVNSKPAQQFLDSFRVIGAEGTAKLTRDELIEKLKDF